MVGCVDKAADTLPAPSTLPNTTLRNNLNENTYLLSVEMFRHVQGVDVLREMNITVSPLSQLSRPSVRKSSVRKVFFLAAAFSIFRVVFAEPYSESRLKFKVAVHAVKHV